MCERSRSLDYKVHVSQDQQPIIHITGALDCTVYSVTRHLARGGGTPI